MNNDHNDLARLDELPLSVRNEIRQLQVDGYYVNRLWANGVELRKGPITGPLRFIFSLVLLFCMPVLPFVARWAVSNLFGYRHRILLALDEREPSIRFF